MTKIQELLNKIDVVLNHKAIVSAYEEPKLHIIKISIPYATERFIMTKKKLNKMITYDEYCDFIKKYMCKKYKEYFQ